MARSAPRVTTVLVVTGGDAVPPEALEGLGPVDFVVAADSGLDHSQRLGLEPDVVIGDFDSVSDAALEAFSGPIERHPVAKDATDLELALRHAVERGPDRIVVVGGHGGRMDHLLANALVITTVPEHIEVEWRAGLAAVYVVHRRLDVTGTVGQTISLVPVGGDVSGVTATGVRWPLAGATLPSGSTLGVSNEFAAPLVHISVEEGTLLVILPGQS